MWVLPTIMKTALITESATFTWDGTESSIVAKIIDRKEDNEKNLKYIKRSFAFDESKANINNYAVMVSLGLPIYLHALLGNDLTVRLFGSTEKTVTIPAAIELLTPRCLQMYVCSDGDDRQFVWRELTEDGKEWREVCKKTDAWPKEAEPKGNSDEEAEEKWLKSDYKDHVVYVARKSWKLNNLK